MSHYLSVFPVGDTWRNLPFLLLFDCHLQQKGDVNCNMFWQATSFWFFNIKWKQNVSNISTNCTFLLGECMTGAGGEGGPRGIFLLILKNTIIAIKFLHHFPQTGGGITGTEKWVVEHYLVCIGKIVKRIVTTNDDRVTAKFHFTICSKITSL